MCYLLSLVTFFQYYFSLFFSSLTNSLRNINDNTVLTAVEIISIITTIIMNPRLIQLGGVCLRIPAMVSASLCQRPQQQRPLATDTCMTPGTPKSLSRLKGGLDFPWTHDLHLPRPWRLRHRLAHPGEVGVVGLLVDPPVGPLSCPATDPRSLRQQPQVRVVQ